MKTEFIPAKYRAYLLPLASVSANVKLCWPSTGKPSILTLHVIGWQIFWMLDLCLLLFSVWLWCPQWVGAGWSVFLSSPASFSLDSSWWVLSKWCWNMLRKIEVDVYFWLTCLLFSFFSLFPSLHGSRSQQGTYKEPCLHLIGSLGWMVPPYLKENYGNLKWWVWEVPFSYLCLLWLWQFQLSNKQK